MIALVSALVLAGQAAAAPAPAPATAPAAADSISFELITGLSSSGWTIEADGKGRFFDYNRHTHEADPKMQQAFTGPADNYAFALKQLANYQAYAKPGEGCPIGEGDVVGFRLIWSEAGARRTATFTDSCGGVPTDLLDRVAPVGQRIDRLLAVPPADAGSGEG